MTTVTLIDNYDSFTWNLVHCLGALGADVTVFRNDKVSMAEIMSAAPNAIVLSPGPCRPRDAGICLELIETAGSILPNRLVFRAAKANNDPIAGLVSW
jgi:anthranilate synthase component II